MSNPSLCACGCGGVPNRGVRFIQYHCNRGEHNPRWNGGASANGFGYVLLHAPAEAASKTRNYALEHIIVAERALGRPLPPGAQVHHVNENKADNRPENLVICPDAAYHMLLHQRLRALRACGNANWRKCWICKSYDEPSSLSIHGKKAYHLACYSAYQRRKRVSGSLHPTTLPAEVAP